MRRHRSRRRNKQRKIIIISMCSLLLIMTVGYAAMQTNLEIKAKGNVVKKTTAGSDLVDMAGIVNSGDGLYKDVYEENVYTYRGTSPNNYVIFNDELWRIISVNTSDNTIKIIRNEILENRAFDTASGRYQGKEGYCDSSSFGCSIYGRLNNLYDNNDNLLTALLSRKLPDKDASINIYLNETYYNDLLNTSAKVMIIDNKYKVGSLSSQNSGTLSIDLNNAKQVIWKGEIALIDATEYVRASTNSSCTSMSSAFDKCAVNNWMHINYEYWTISPSGDYFTSYFVLYISEKGQVSSNNAYAYAKRGIRPVVTLSPEVQITSGDGSESSPFELTM